MSDDGERHAREKRGWWPGWIWSVPIAAAGLVAWLAVRSVSQSGPEVTVTFPDVANLKAGDTKVEFESMDVGQVDDVKLDPDLRHVTVRMQLSPDLADHLGRGTEFWIIGKGSSLANPADIKALITGVSIGIQPRPGKQLASYQGSSHPPVLSLGAEGSRYVLHAATLGSINRGTTIFMLDQPVGKVQQTRMTNGNGFDVDVFIDKPYNRFVHAGSRFWSAGPVHVATGGNGVAVRFQSIPALFGGAIAFETPDGPAAGPVAHGGARFTLFGSEDAARNAPDDEAVAYRSVFPTADGVPKVNAPVRLLGERVGSVTESRLVYDPVNGAISVEARFVVEPHAITLASGAWTDPRAQMDAMMGRLVSEGLEASLSSTPPVIGGEGISLALVAGKGGVLGPGPVPEIPVRGGGGGVAGIMAGANDVMARINEMPLAQIGDNLREISRHLATLTRSPALEATLRHVDRSTANLERVTDEARRDLPPTLAALKATVAEAQASLTSAQGLLSAQGQSASGPHSEALPETLYEVSRAARSLRELADLLDRQPSSLLMGRGG